MPDLEPLQRIFLHMVRDLLLCDHLADVGNDIEDWSKIFGVDVPGGGDDGDGFELDAIDEMLGCEKPGKRGEDFRALVRAERLRDAAGERWEIGAPFTARDEQMMAKGARRQLSRCTYQASDALGDADPTATAWDEVLEACQRREAEPPVADALAGADAYPYFVVEIEDQDERGLDQHAAFEILRAALPSLGFKLRACGTRESMRQYFADEQARLDREDLAEFFTEYRLARAAREAEEDSR